MQKGANVHQRCENRNREGCRRRATGRARGVVEVNATEGGGGADLAWVVPAMLAAPLKRVRCFNGEAQLHVWKLMKGSHRLINEVVIFISSHIHHQTPLLG
ncbi:hypothetical protein H6P81_004362 [Aristolochia fimbriata]|uniref:Uncharacterized protein n=1 Tax=Aristolochia fimbriata TaxID=158543 RepID=A0AAV7FFP8_ARIFI|nr:hypothetical protein H6P81_004362 [Aristolochia fimbriata]